MVFHDEMVKYWCFLNLYGYAKCHEWHCEEESKGYRKLNKWFMGRRNRFIPIEPMERPEVIPQTWYDATRQDVDKGTKQSGIKSGFEKWVKWEKDTKAVYEDAYLSLIEMGEPAAADFVMNLVNDVDEELEKAESKHLALESVGYDLSLIQSEQDGLIRKYEGLYF